MNFVLKPSLEHRALVKIAVSLWNQNDVGAIISLAKVKKLTREDFYPIHEEWKEIEARVTEKVPQLSLPQLLEEKVSCFIRPIGLQIYKWIKFHCIRYDLPLNLPLELCWTPQGTVDGKRTAEVLVKDESLDIDTRFMLACICCLEEDIIALWNTVSEELKQSVFSVHSVTEWGKKWIIVIWSYIMQRRGWGNLWRVSYQREFEKHAYHDNKVAVEYLLQKLTPQERKASLVRVAKYVDDADVVCFLISEMDDEQQMEVFKFNPYKVLKFFLQWPLQGFFIEIANCMWGFLSKDDFQFTLRNIIHKVRVGYKDWNYQKLFREFWQKSPDALKSLLANEIDESYLLLPSFDIKDKEFVRLILTGATVAAREKLIYSDRMNDFWQDCIRDDEWDFLEFCIRECFPSKDLMLNFKGEFEKHVMRDDVEDIFVRNKQKWDEVFCFSGDSVCKYDKRNADEGECSSSKRFRSLQ